MGAWRFQTAGDVYKRQHLKHTEGGDFRQATYRAVRQGLMMADQIHKTQLLEPWYAFRLELPSDNVGRAMNDIQNMGGSFDPPETGADGDTTLLTGTAPASTMRSYPMEVVGYTRGRGHLTLTLDGYRPCHNAAAVSYTHLDVYKRQGWGRGASRQPGRPARASPARRHFSG